MICGSWGPALLLLCLLLLLLRFRPPLLLELLLPRQLPPPPLRLLLPPLRLPTIRFEFNALASSTAAWSPTVCRQSAT